MNTNLKYKLSIYISVLCSHNAYSNGVQVIASKNISKYSYYKYNFSKVYSNRVRICKYPGRCTFVHQLEVYPLY